MTDRKRFRLGGVWSRRAQSGAEVMSGRLPLARLAQLLDEAIAWGDESLSIVVFQNTFKSEPNDPDYAVFVEPNPPRAPKGRGTPSTK